MSPWREVTRGMRALLHPSARRDEIADEVCQYLDDATDAGRARGLTEEEARRAALRELGNPRAVEEQLGSYGWENLVRSVFFDLRFAARRLRTRPGFTIVSTLTLALGIGAATAIFSAVNPILFKPLPYPHPERILTTWSTWQGARSELAFGTFRELTERSRSFDDLAVFEPWQPAMTGSSQPERLEGQSVSAQFFRVLGVVPALGRDFRAGEDTANGSRIVILSDSFWNRRFHSDPTIVGRALALDGDTYTVIGVMPRGFKDVLAPSAEVWTPTQYDARNIAAEFNSSEWGNHLRMVGRLSAGVSRAQATREIAGIARTPWPQFPRPRWASLERGLIVDSLQQDIAKTVRPALLAVFGAVLLVLVIACVNVVNLVLAQRAQRRGEFAMRQALGSSRTRLVRQLVTESLLLSLLGGAGSIAFAFASVHGLIALSPAELPRLDAIAVDTAALLFALAAATVAGLIAGVVPALHIPRHELRPLLQLSSARAAGGHARTRRILVVTEVALAFVLLVAAGLLLRSMQQLLAVSPGFDPSNLLTLQVHTAGHQFDDLTSAPGPGMRARQRFYLQALEAVRRVPGVQQAAFTSVLPLSDDLAVNSTFGAQFEDQPADVGINVFRYAVSPGYCPAMGIPLLRGRLLDEHDTADAPQAALISESLARQHFGSANPLGKRFHVGPRDRPWYTVVGVVGDVRQTSLAINDPDAVYIPLEQSWFPEDAVSYVVRARSDASSLAAAVRNAVWSVDANQPIVRMLTMDRLIALTEAERRFVLVLFEAFGVVALVLAAVGIYGLLSGSVTERTREIGVRAALGASRGRILALILRDGMRLTAIGIALGLAVALVAVRALASLLFGVSTLDPVAWAGVVLVLSALAAIACWAPAWRAARVDPAVTLRVE